MGSVVQSVLYMQIICILWGSFVAGHFLSFASGKRGKCPFFQLMSNFTPSPPPGEQQDQKHSMQVHSRRQAWFVHAIGGIIMS